jgi:hypothetical protein
MRIDGACHCGYITIEGEADPEKTTICHCKDCQTGTGSAFRVSVPVAGATFRMSGEPTTYLKTTADSGNPRAQAFCPRCGSPIYSTTPGEDRQASYMVRVGILRQRDQFVPRRQIWFRSTQPWVTRAERGPIRPRAALDRCAAFQSDLDQIVHRLQIPPEFGTGAEATPLLVIDDFDIGRTLLGPCETDAPLSVDADRVLASTVSR